jgi:flagellar FliJ protein
MKPFPLQTVYELMRKRMDDATNRLAQLIALEKNEKDKLELLDRYRGEYAARFLEASQKGLKPSEWNNHREFLGRIDEAIDSQEKVVEERIQDTRRGQEAWKEQRKKLKAFDTLAARHEAKEERREARLEQKSQDEFALRSGNRASGFPRSGIGEPGIHAHSPENGWQETGNGSANGEKRRE